jgi:hypothetical protein
MPTILHMLGIKTGLDFDGRILYEAFKKGPDANKLPLKTATYYAENPELSYRAVLQLSVIGEKWYLDKAWRNK